MTDSKVVRNSVFDDEKHVSKIVSKNPPKYLGRSEFGTRYKFKSDIISSKPTSVIKNEQKLLGRN